MNPFERECQSLVDSLDGVLLCGVVDHAGRRVLGARGVAPVTAEIESALVEAALELLERGGTTAADTEAPGYAELQLTDARARYFAKRLGDGPRMAVLVTHKDTNAGLGWAQLRALVTELQDQD